MTDLIKRKKEEEKNDDFSQYHIKLKNHFITDLIFSNLMHDNMKNNVQQITNLIQYMKIIF